MLQSQEINWWLELAKIAAPILSTFALGWWISRHTERYKTELAKGIHRFQTVLPRRLETCGELIETTRLIQLELKSCLQTVEGIGWFYRGNEEWQEQDLSESTTRIFKFTQKLRKTVGMNLLLFDKETVDHLKHVISKLDETQLHFVNVYDEENDESTITAKTTEGFEKAKTAVNVEVPELIKQLERNLRSLLDS